MFPEMFTKDSISVSSVGDLSFYKVHDDPDLTNVQCGINFMFQFV